MIKPRDRVIVSGGRKELIASMIRRSDKDLRMIALLLDQILVAKVTSVEVDRFLDVYWMNGLNKYTRDTNIWLEVQRFALELELYDADIEMQQRGFFGEARVLKLSRRLRDMIRAVHKI